MKKNIVLLILWMFCLAQTIYASPTPVKVDGNYGYANEEGELVIPALYHSAEEFTNDGLALVSMDVQGDGWPFEYGFIDETGKEVIPLRYQNLTQFVEGFAVAQKNGKFGYITPSGAVAIDFLYTEASTFSNGKAVVKLNGETMVISRPNWEESTLMIRETDYVSFQSPGEFVSYFYNALSNFDGSLVSESDYVVMEKYFSALLNKMRSLNAQVEGDSIMILSDDYAEILAESKEIYASLLDALDSCGISTTESMEGYLRLIYNGIANVQHNGQSVVIDSNVTYQIVPFPVPYFDKNTYNGFTQNSQFNDYLQERLQAMNGESPNVSGSQGLIDYINHIFVNLESLEISSSFNKVTIGTEKQSSFFKEISELTQQIHSILEQYNITLTENITSNLLVLVNGNNLDKQVKFQLNSEYLLPYLNGIDGIRVIVGSSGEGVYFPSAELSILLSGRENLYFEVHYQSDSTTVKFYAADGKTEVTELPTSFFFMMPVASRTSTTYAFLSNGSTQNWGGVVQLNNTIEFSTSYAGEYVTKEARATINDIADLSFETQEKIHFLVSKGFFTLDDGAFYPEEPLTREDLICALVKLFFAQNSEATSQFKDVSPEDENYALISAAYQSGIVGGFEDNTFRGSSLTSRLEIVAFLSRTLAEYKGFNTIADPYETIQVFSDYVEFPDWSVELLALAIEHHLIETYGNFGSFEQVTRREVAQLLYTLFMELYDSPYTTVNSLVTYQVKEGVSMTLVPLYIGIFAIIATLLGTFIYQKHRSQKRIMERMRIVAEAMEKGFENAENLVDYDDYEDD